jgi:hypothetical protein
MQALTTTQHIFREQKHDYDVHEVPNLAEDAVVYFTVRNPYHRFMSMWHHHNTKWSAPGRPLWHEMEPGNIVSFCECFFKRYEAYKASNVRPYKPYWDEVWVQPLWDRYTYITEHILRTQVIHIVKFDYIEDFIRKLAPFARIPHVNKSTYYEDNETCWAKLDIPTRLKIKDWAMDDMRFGNYFIPAEFT